MKIKPILGKWQWEWNFGRDWQRLERGWRFVSFGLLKLKKLPPQGVKLSKSDYHGFLIQFAVWLPFESV